LNPEWIHPDELERISASRSPRGPVSPASPAEVARVLNKVFVTGRLRRIPKNPQHRDVVLAILCLNMRRRRSYTEREINEYLQDVLKTLKAMVDHVTCRRFLVDLGFLKRDRAGARYLLNYPKIERTLSVDVANAAEALLEEALDRHG